MQGCGVGHEKFRLRLQDILRLWVRLRLHPPPPPPLPQFCGRKVKTSHTTPHTTSSHTTPLITPHHTKPHITSSHTTPHTTRHNTSYQAIPHRASLHLTPHHSLHPAPHTTHPTIHHIQSLNTSWLTPYPTTSHLTPHSMLIWYRLLFRNSHLFNLITMHWLTLVESVSLVSVWCVGTENYSTYSSKEKKCMLTWYKLIFRNCHIYSF